MEISQQSLLRDAMRRLGLTRDQFADRTGVKRRTLDSWLLPEASKDVRTMPANMRLLVDELLDRAGLTAASLAPAARPGFGGSRHLLTVDQVDRAALDRLFLVADHMQPFAGRRRVTRVLEGAVLANLFFEASTRTRLSFGAAFARLGGAVLDTTGFTFSSMAKGESIHDTARVVAGYADVIVVRHPDGGSVAQFAAASGVPVVNGGDGPGEHPSQALLDLYTLQREFSRLGKLVDGSSVAVIGDLRYGRAVHSLLRLLSRYDRVRVKWCAPAGLGLPHDLAAVLRERGHEVVEAPTLADALAGADAVYATRIQAERFGPDAPEVGVDHRLTRAVADAHLAPDAVILHPLPRDSRPGAVDLDDDLLGDPRLAVFRQTDNGVAVRMALFTELLGVSHLVETDTRAAAWFVPDDFGAEVAR